MIHGLFVWNYRLNFKIVVRLNILLKWTVYRERDIVPISKEPFSMVFEAWRTLEHIWSIDKGDSTSSSSKRSFYSYQAVPGITMYLRLVCLFRFNCSRAWCRIWLLWIMYFNVLRIITFTSFSLELKMVFTMCFVYSLWFLQQTCLCTEKKEKHWPNQEIKRVLFSPLYTISIWFKFLFTIVAT